MLKIQLYDICSMEFNIGHWNASYQYWNREHSVRTVNVNRTQSGFLYLYGSTCEYSIEGERLYAKTGQIVYLPPYIRYSSVFRSDNPLLPSSILINFSLADDKGQEISLSDRVFHICSDGDEKRYLDIFKRIVEIANMPIPNVAAVKQHIYYLFSEFSHAAGECQLSAEKLMMIRPAIEYLKSDANQNLSIAELAKLCCVSEAYFRRLFKQYFGVSPAKFRQQRKIEKARRMVEMDSGYTLTEIAEMLGFSDPAYFSRSFKRIYGETPRMVQRQIRGP